MSTSLEKLIDDLANDDTKGKLVKKLGLIVIRMKVSEALEDIRI